MKCLSESHTLRRLSFISIALALITILSVAHYEHSLEKEFNPESKSTKIPTLFILDLYKHQVGQFNSIVDAESKLGLMIQTRITFINDEAVESYATKLTNDYFYTENKIYHQGLSCINQSLWLKGNGLMQMMTLLKPLLKNVSLDV